MSNSMRLVVFAAYMVATAANSAEPTGTNEQPNSIWLEQLTQPIRDRQARAESAASCASTACHGGPRAGIGSSLAVRGSEYPLWLEKDPHAQAWRTLCSDTSVAMLERLKVFRDGKVIDQAAFNNCLACHNPTTNQNYALQAEGVGCASCHGPAERWRGDHYRVNRDDLANSQCGMVPNKNLLARARTCAACHVGDSDRDMNHDIIAAGHPALHYEFATFHNMLPKHWREPTSEDFEAQLWLVGQLAALDASLALLEARATKKLSLSTWPEFSASNCSACHQNLRIETEDFSAPVRSVASFSSWNRFGVEQLLKLNQIEGSGIAAGETLQLALTELSHSMVAGTAGHRLNAAEAASKSRIALDNWLKCSAQSVNAFGAQQLQRLAAVSMQNQAELGQWEFTTQAYLAAVASRMSWRTSSSSIAVAQQLRSGLLFRPFTNSVALEDEPNRNVSAAVARLAHLLESTQDLSLPPLREPLDLRFELVPVPHRQ